MKKFLLSLAAISVLSLPLIGLAASATVSPVMITTTDQLTNLINNIGTWIFGIVIAIAIIFFVLAGFYFITAQGDPAKVGKAREMITYAIVGVVVAILAKGIPLLLANILKSNK